VATTTVQRLHGACTVIAWSQLSDVLSTPLTPASLVLAVAVVFVIGAPFFAAALQATLEKRLRERTLQTIARARRTMGKGMSDPMRAEPKDTSTERTREGED
jgi:cation transport ATPase